MPLLPMPLLPMPLLEAITDIAAADDALRQRRYGVIETHAGELVSVTLRPWPHLVSLRELWPLGDAWRPAGPPDRCRLYYNQPQGHEDFLALRYVACTAGASYATFRAALRALDEIAAIKGSRALVCDAANQRLSERFMRRMGWEPHAPMWGRRNFIRRFAS
ncbi:hypothetical protein Pla108_05630 [Botrimarina colliarenosi]|uniref:N-acetyltransferase domain-containing protein n=1 Tax=Botrimarina colliarenosi TaxID=2528001 RepID=A0A5C6AJN7_9BACT|nr:hypothetical protein [Botrimarina colliarenosi]TWT99620.1 hypothetical protein Pla108_05630 [Botrimarina colliarenosi]